MLGLKGVVENQLEVISHAVKAVNKHKTFLIISLFPPINSLLLINRMQKANNMTMAPMYIIIRYEPIMELPRLISSSP